MRTRVIQALVGLLVGAVLIVLVAQKTDWTKVRQVLSAGHYWWLIGSFFCLALHYAMKALRWKVLLDEHHVQRFSLVFRTMMVGFFMNNVFPARVGELSRPYLLSANSPRFPFSFALATVVADKLLDLEVLAVLFILAASLFALPEWTDTAIWLVGLFVLGSFFAAWLLARFRLGNKVKRWVEGESVDGTTGSIRGRFGGVLQRFLAGFSTLGSPLVMLRASFFSFVSFAILVVGTVMTMKALGLPSGTGEAILVIAFMGIGFALPAPPTYAGNIHFFAALAVQLGGVGDKETGLALGILIHVVEVFVIVGLGFPSLLSLRWKAPNRRSYNSS